MAKATSRIAYSRIAMAIGTLVGTLLGVQALSAGSADASTLRSSIVSIAEHELNDNTRNYEYGGNDNCTYYSGQVTSWPACGPSGWAGGGPGYAWCANFAKYVWREAPVADVTGLTTWAYSFAKYGAANGTLHLAGAGYTPQPGDALVFDWDSPYIDLSSIGSMSHEAASDIDHVGIVKSYSAGTVTTIEGNSGDQVRQNSYSYSNAVIRAYVSPVGADDPIGGWSISGDGRADLATFATDGTISVFQNSGWSPTGSTYAWGSHPVTGAGFDPARTDLG